MVSWPKSFSFWCTLNKSRELGTYKLYSTQQKKNFWKTFGANRCPQILTVIFRFFLGTEFNRNSVGHDLIKNNLKQNLHVLKNKNNNFLFCQFFIITFVLCIHGRLMLRSCLLISPYYGNKSSQNYCHHNEKRLLICCCFFFFNFEEERHRNLKFLITNSIFFFVIYRHTQGRCWNVPSHMVLKIFVFFFENILALTDKEKKHVIEFNKIKNLIWTHNGVFAS